MSPVLDEALWRRDMRRTELLRLSAVEAAEFRVTAWMLVDSLDWVLRLVGDGAVDGLGDEDFAQFVVAQARLKEAQGALGRGGGSA